MAIAGRTKKLRHIVGPLAMLLLASALAQGQTSAYSGQAFTASRQVSPGSYAPVLTIPYARVFVCVSAFNNTVNGCANPLAIYSDAALTQPVAQPLIADAQGNYSFFASPGLAYAVVTPPNASSFLQSPIAVASSPGSQFGWINAMAAPYQAKCDGVTDDTTAIQSAVTAAKRTNSGGTLQPLVLPPGYCRVSSTVDLTGIALMGGGGRESGITQIGPTTTNPGRDMLTTHGTTSISNVRVNGGWDGTTAGLNGNGLTIIKDANNGLSAYVVSMDNVWIQSVGKNGIQTTDGAYQSFRNLRVSTVGLNAFQANSGFIPGFQTTTIAFTGQNILSDAPNGYSLVCQSCISTSLSGSVTTGENTKGFLFTGDGRNLDTSHLYLEGTIGGKCIDFSNSTGIGLVVSDNYGPACTGVTPDDLKGWSSVSVVSNDTGTVNFNDGLSTVLRSYNVNTNDPQTYRIAVSDATTIQGAWTTWGIASLTPGGSWSAKLNIVALDGSAQPKAAHDIVISSVHNSIPIGGVTLTCTIGDGTAQGAPNIGGNPNLTTSGQFQCRTSNYAAFAGPPRILGEISLQVSRQQSGGGVALSTPDAVNAGLVHAGNGVSQFISGVGQFCSGILVSTTATACQ